ncbi:MAG: hypothetical protein PHS17_09335 [Desulfobacterales bacterium]|nr:hypothetical protein [Desulfobacterales bacterium]
MSLQRKMQMQNRARTGEQEGDIQYQTRVSVVLVSRFAVGKTEERMPHSTSQKQDEAGKGTETLMNAIRIQRA